MKTEKIFGIAAKIFFVELSIVRNPILKKISPIYFLIKSSNLKNDNIHQTLYMYKISFIETFTLFAKWFVLFTHCGFLFGKKRWISFELILTFFWTEKKT